MNDVSTDLPRHSDGVHGLEWHGLSRRADVLSIRERPCTRLRTQNFLVRFSSQSSISFRGGATAELTPPAVDVQQHTCLPSPLIFTQEGVLSRPIYGSTTRRTKGTRLARLAGCDSVSTAISDQTRRTTARVTAVDHWEALARHASLTKLSRLALTWLHVCLSLWER